MSVSLRQTLDPMRRLERRRDVLALECAARLRAQVADAAEVLNDRFGATEVWRFGSLTTGAVHADSDVNLGVRGISAAEHMRAWAAVDRFEDAEVDLVRLEEAPASLVARISREGKRL